MRTETLKVDDIKLAPYNPRVALKAGDLAYEKIKRSIEEFGLVEPLVWNVATGHLVGGHQRLQVLKDMGAITVVVSVVDIADLKREKALNVALNQVAGAFDDEKLAALLDSIDDGTFDATLTGFDSEEIKRKLEGLDAPDEFKELNENLETHATPSSMRLPVLRKRSEEVVSLRGAARPPYGVPTMREICDRKTNGFKVVSTFSGCGGSCLGFEMAGYDVLWANEFIPAAQETYRLNHPGVILNCEDIRTVEARDVLSRIRKEPGEVDVLEGSPPCASFSTAGKREKGWGDVRKYSDSEQRVDDLFFEFIR